jgi:tetratricopeptide (TPR) repeat protein
MRPSFHVILACTALASAHVVHARQASVLDADAWVEAIALHEPGAADRSLRRVAGWSWKTLGPVLADLRQRGTEPLQLKSAMLLLDIAVHVPVDDRRLPERPSRGFAVVAEDGEHRGTTSLDPHLDEARRLLDGVAADPDAPDYEAMRGHVVAWYRGVSAILARRWNLADLEPHVRKAVARFPDDPGILFDAGCFEETYASPVMQAAVMQTAEPGKPSRTSTTDRLRRYAHSPGRLLARAEEYFRGAVRRESGFTEARVRLGRVQTGRNRPTDAIHELQQAVRMPGDATLKYYAWLFYGEALERVARNDEAMTAYRAAERLFPGAQSPQMAIGRLAGELGDRATAAAAIERVLSADIGSDSHFDPWWMYHRASGRDAEPIYRKLAATIQAVRLEPGHAWKARK